MPNPAFSSSSYKYGFNGKRIDNEINVDGGDYDFGARIYDSRLARWFSPDPLGCKYASHSTFNYALNCPIVFLDNGGKDVVLYDKTGNKVATITKAGTVVERGMDNSPILIAYNSAKAYLKGHDKGTFSELENSSKILEIRYSDSPDGVANFQNSGATVSGTDLNGTGTIDQANEVQSAQYDDATKMGVIYWNPENGGEDGEGNKHSPALILVHEMRHAKHFISNLIKFVKDNMTHDANFDDKEEKTTINETNEISKSLGNGDGGDGQTHRRTSHGARRVFKTFGVTSFLEMIKIKSTTESPSTVPTYPGGVIMPK